MVGFANVSRLHRRIVTDGAEHFTGWRKVPNAGTAAGYWLDLTMMPGTPSPVYYSSTPAVAAVLAQSTHGGLRHGGNVSPASKHVREIVAYSATAGVANTMLLLCDYLLYYPFIAEDAVDEEQALDNTETLTRYTDGEGVRILPVVQFPHSSTGVVYRCTYTNQDGVGGRLTASATFGASVAAGSILSSGYQAAGRIAPFLALQDGDTGVRSIESVNVSSPGDVGAFALVLVKPLVTLAMRGVDAAVEVDTLLHRALSMPVVEDDAFLSFVAQTAGNMSGGQILGTLTTTWSE